MKYLLILIMLVIYQVPLYSQLEPEIKIRTLPVTPLPSPNMHVSEGFSQRIALTGTLVAYEDDLSEMDGGTLGFIYEHGVNKISFSFPVQVCFLSGNYKEEDIPGSYIDAQYDSFMMGVDMGFSLYLNNTSFILFVFGGFHFGICYYHHMWEEEGIDYNVNHDSEINFEINEFRGGVKCRIGNDDVASYFIYQIVSTRFRGHTGGFYENYVYDDSVNLNMTQSFLGMDFEMYSFVAGVLFSVNGESNMFLFHVGYNFQF